MRLDETGRVGRDDGAVARNAMVDSQVRPNKVTDPRLLASMRALPREAFLPASLRARAYADSDVKLAHGRAMIQPMVTARLVQLAALRPPERVLVVGAGTGYLAALLESCGLQVTAVEEDADLLAIARPALSVWAPCVQLVVGSIAAGAPGAAPFDLVMIEGAVEELPRALVSQVAEKGRLVMVRAASGGLGQAVIGRHSGGQLSFVPAFDCAVTLLPMMRRSAGFVF